MTELAPEMMTGTASPDPASKPRKHAVPKKRKSTTSTHEGTDEDGASPESSATGNGKLKKVRATSCVLHVASTELTNDFGKLRSLHSCSPKSRELATLVGERRSGEPVTRSRQGEPTETDYASRAFSRCNPIPDTDPPICTYCSKHHLDCTWVSSTQFAPRCRESS